MLINTQKHIFTCFFTKLIFQEKLRHKKSGVDLNYKPILSHVHAGRTTKFASVEGL